MENYSIVSAGSAMTIISRPNTEFLYSLEKNGASIYVLPQEKYLLTPLDISSSSLLFESESELNKYLLSINDNSLKSDFYFSAIETQSMQATLEKLNAEYSENYKVNIFKIETIEDSKEQIDRVVLERNQNRYFKQLILIFGNLVQKNNPGIYEWAFKKKIGELTESYELILVNKKEKKFLDIKKHLMSYIDSVKKTNQKDELGFEYRMLIDFSKNLKDNDEIIYK